jgi:oxygen-dependent protoporphyrinogen oxidase
MNIAIIGGGISGLTTAYYIKKNRPNVNVTIYEKENNIGGKMQTHDVNGFKFEAGSNGFLSNKPDTFKFVEDVGANELVEKSNDNARKRFIFKDKLHKLPSGPKDFLTTNLITSYAKLRVAMEYFIKPKLDDKDETVQEFGYRRLGKNFTDNFLDPMTNGIFASNCNDLSLKSAFPVIANLEKEYGGLFKGMIAKKKGGAPGGVLMSFKNGVSSFIDYLEDNIDVKIIKDCNISNIIDTGISYILESNLGKFTANRVVFTTPSFVTASIIREMYEALAISLDKIPYSPVSVVGFGYNQLEDELNGFGLLTVKSANLEILGILWDSSIFENRAPLGKKSLRILIGGSRSPELALEDEKTLVQFAKNGVKTCMNIEQEPDTIFVKKYKNAIPRYELGHSEIVKEIFEQIEDNDRLFIGGNAYYGVGLNDCISNSIKLANDVIETIKEDKKDEDIQKD